MMNALKDTLEAFVALLPQIGIGFLLLLGVLIAAAALSNPGWRRAAPPPEHDADARTSDADLVARGHDGHD